jgi:hypothetical protein
MEITVGVLSALLTTALISILAFFARNLIAELISYPFQKEHSKFLDELRWHRKVQEQAARVAEYMALVRRLKESSPESDFERANQLSWELAMWIPDEIYRQMTMAIVQPDQNVNELSVVVAVRKLLLGDGAGSLGPDEIAHHAPGVGQKNRQQVTPADS